MINELESMSKKVVMTSLEVLNQHWLGVAKETCTDGQSPGQI
jgi:hypothetical protein